MSDDVEGKAAAPDMTLAEVVLMSVTSSTWLPLLSSLETVRIKAEIGSVVSLQCR